MKYLYYYSVIVTIIAVIFIGNTVKLLEVSTVEVSNKCESLESQVRRMTTDDTNKLMIVVAETLTANYKEATREQVEKEHENYSNRLALEHMNEVMSVLVKSIGDMPTSTIKVK